jgi:hypothetical protein
MRLKLLVLATIALILNLVTISPVKAEIGITTVNTQTMAKLGCVQTLCQSFRLVEEMAPVFMNVGSNIKSHIFFRQDLGDRLFNLNPKSGVACLLDGEGSQDGSIFCGQLDKF